VAGKLALMAIFNHSDIVMTESRSGWMKSEIWQMAADFIANPFAVIYSVLGVGWILAMKYTEKGRAALPFLLTLFGFMGLLPLVYDETRVVAVVSFPLIFVFWLSNPQTLKSLNDRLVAEMVLLWIIIPWVWMWEGRVMPSLFLQDLYRVFRFVMA
jgi:hypothetical protein